MGLFTILSIPEIIKVLKFCFYLKHTYKIIRNNLYATQTQAAKILTMLVD